MLNSPATRDDPDFVATKAIITNQIATTENLEELSSVYDCFVKAFKPLGSRLIGGAIQGSTSETANTDPNRFPRILRRDSLDDEVRKRDQNTCALTGKKDPSRSGDLQVAHIIPFSIANQSPPVKSLIKALIPWLPDNFFDDLDTCSNAILVRPEVHVSLRRFQWYIDVKEAGNNNELIYFARSIPLGGGSILNDPGHCRMSANDLTSVQSIQSTEGMQLLIGPSTPEHPRPSSVYCKVHKLISRIVEMRGGAKAVWTDIIDDMEDEDMVTFSREELERIDRFLDSWQSQATLTE